MRQLPVRAPPGPLTARKTGDIVQPVVAGLDPRARLTVIASGLDISHAGRSVTWEFLLSLPAHRAQALLSRAPAADASEIDSTPLVLRQGIGPVDADAEHTPALLLGCRHDVSGNDAPVASDCNRP